MTEIEVTDRYQALDIPYPDPETMCEGQCEGTGVVPIYSEDGVFRDQLKSAKGCHVVEEIEEDERLHSLWLEAEAKEPAEDGWHFVKCPDCNGTGKAR